jgi:DNA replication and repair protein RecF
MTRPVTRTALTRLTLTDFRSYSGADLPLDGGPVFLVGPNGAGKTNLLEAVSLLIPGRGLRGSSIAELGRREPGEAQGRAWAISAVVGDGEGETRIGTGIETPGAARRTVRIEGETLPPGRLAEHLRQVWLTPAQDRLFLEGAGERRRFLDRLVFAGDPGHGPRVQTYERSMRERMRLLTEGPADPAWLDALEAQLAEVGAALVTARVGTVSALQAEIDGRGDRPFPQARLSLTGDWAQMVSEGAPETEIAQRLAPAYKAARARDAEAGRALTGPHRGDLAVIHAEKDRPAAECSTGEQKALILNLVLAQAARLARVGAAPAPILLLDEVAAHLDKTRRAALFDEIEALGLQAFLTGTDEALFEALAGRAQGVRVEAGALEALGA